MPLPADRPPIRPGHALRTWLGFVVGVCTGAGLGGWIAHQVSQIEPPPMRPAFRTDAEDHAEQLRNEAWDPNALLRGKDRPLEPLSLAGPASPGVPAAGALSQSIAAIDLPVLPAAPPKPPDLPALPAHALIVIETGTVADLDTVQAQRAALAAAGTPARIVRSRSTTGQSFFLRMGPFDSREDARQARNAVVAQGMTAHARDFSSPP